LGSFEACRSWCGGGIAGDRLVSTMPSTSSGTSELEQTADEIGVAAAHHDLGALGLLAAHLDDQGLDAGATLQALVGDLLTERHHGLGVAQVQDHRAVIGLLDDPGDQIAVASLVQVEHLGTLRIAQALQNHLFGGLGTDAAELTRGVLPLARDIAVLVESARRP
jgi:hypothetical protein